MAHSIQWITLEQWPTLSTGLLGNNLPHSTQHSSFMVSFTQFALLFPTLFIHGIIYSVCPTLSHTLLSWCHLFSLPYSLPHSSFMLLKIINSASAKSCELDPIPTTLLYENLDILLPTITNIINTSLTTGIVPRIWRLPSSNLCWKSHHSTKIFWKTTAPFLTFQNSWKSRSPKTSLPTPRKQPQQPLSVSLPSRTQHWDRFVTCCNWYSLRSGQWPHFYSSFVGAFWSFWHYTGRKTPTYLLTYFWHYWPPKSPLPPELCFWHSVYCTPMVSVIPLREISVHFSQ